MDEIVFAPLDAPVEYGDLFALRQPPEFFATSFASSVGVLRANLQQPALETTSYAVTQGSLSVTVGIDVVLSPTSEILRAAIPTPRLFMVGSDIVVVPQYSILDAYLPAGQLITETYQIRIDNMQETPIPAPMFVGSDATELLSVVSPLPAAFFADEIPVVENFVYSVGPNPYMWSFGAWSTGSVVEVARASEVYMAQYRIRLTDIALAFMQQGWRLEGTSRIADAAVMWDRVRTVTFGAIVDLAQAADTADGQFRAMVRLADRVLAMDLPGGRLQALLVLSSIAAAADAYRSGELAVIEDAAVASGVFEDRVIALMALADAVLAGEASTDTVTLLGFTTDVSQATDAPLSIAQLLSRLDDTVGVIMRLSIGTDEYIGWVVNTATKAVSTYDNYPFNSFARVGDTFYAAGPGGIYTLDADDDAGEPISAAVRTALTNFGTGAFKRVPSMYVGYRSDGTLGLKVIHMEPDGTRTEDWYALNSQPASTMREGRVTIGRGLKSVYWAFEVCNIAGSDFDIDSIGLYPVVLQRRV